MTELLRRVGHTRWFVAVARRAAPPLDRFLHQRTGGRLHASTLPTLLLTTTGHRTGLPRTVPLAYVREGDRLAVVGSNFGGTGQPAWSDNLLANPSARVQVGPHATPVHARLATAEERTCFWPAFTAMWPAYDTYVIRAGAAGRDVRLFVL